MTLARQQQELLAALVRGAPVPPDFDAQRLRATSEALLRKRAHEVGRVWPLLRHGLAQEWAPVFAAWASERPKTTTFADGLLLAGYLHRRGQLPAGAVRELALARLDWRVDRVGSVVPRRFPLIRVARVGQVRAVAVGLSRHRWRMVR